MSRPGHVVLALSGGNALGAYQAGAIEALTERGIVPDRVVGTSIGAVTGAIFAGNAPENRMARLGDFWRLAEQNDLLPSPGDGISDTPWSTAIRWAGGLGTLLGGRPGLFTPAVPVQWPYRSPLGLMDSSPTGETLRRLVDFPLLNAARLPLAVVAVDVETGEEVVFDTRRDALTADHLRASAAMPVLFPPVEIGGRHLVDGGLSSNLPLRLALEGLPEGPVLCIALELLPAASRRPGSIGEAAQRAQDLVFACQTRHALEALRREYGLRRHAGEEGPAVTLIHLAYDGASREIAAKPLDFTRTAIRDRWSHGRDDMIRALDRWAAIPQPGSHEIALVGAEPR